MVQLLADLCIETRIRVLEADVLLYFDEGLGGER